MKRIGHVFGLVTLTGLAAAGCGGDLGPTAPPHSSATVFFEIHAPAFVRLISVEVTGPGIDSVLAFNGSIDARGTGSGTIRVGAGGGRLLVAKAFDINGIQTHRGDTTITLLEGVNPTLSLTLTPLAGSVPVVITFGGSGLTVTPDDTTISVGDTVRFGAAGVDTLGNAIPPASVVWSSTSPTVMTVTASGLARARATGTAYVLATFGGASLGRKVTVQ